jgi:hypothetical protein
MNVIQIYFILLFIVAISSGYFLYNLKEFNEPYISLEYKIPAKGLVGWYNKSSFTKQGCLWKDLSGLGNDLIIKGLPEIESNYITGNKGEYLIFPQDNDYIYTVVKVSKSNSIQPLVLSKSKLPIINGNGGYWAIGEVLIYNRQLKQKELNEIKDYTINKFNLKNNQH